MLTPYREGLIQLIPSKSNVSYDDMLLLYPSQVCACDFYVSGAETGIETPGGYQLRQILNIDHHAPVTRMTRFVSSANLAIDQVKQCGLPPGPVVINHTDCDSILSAGIASGCLEPLDEYGAAAIAADHTGAANEIADVLMALDRCRDVALSFTNLARLRAGQPLDSVAAGELNARKLIRGKAESDVAAGRLPVTGGVALGILEGEIDGEFYPALIPEAAVIVVATATKGSPSRWQVKIRLGQAARPGLTLHALKISEFDSGFGGRWNAGSNKRGGGSDRSPESYAEEVRKRLDLWTATAIDRIEQPAAIR